MTVIDLENDRTVLFNHFVCSRSRQFYCVIFTMSRVQRHAKDSSKMENAFMNYINFKVDYDQ